MNKILVFFSVILITISVDAAKKSLNIKKNVEPLVVWDGEEIGKRAKGWAAPKEEDGTSTVSVISIATNKGYKSKNALCWKVKGPEWKGFGWNWFSWWPPDAGTDISDYSSISFWIRFEFDKTSYEKYPQIGNITFNISCSSDGGKRSADVNIINYTKEDILDFEWHKIKIPLKDLLDNETSREFDMKTVWEFGMGLWTADDQDFTLFIDTVSFE